MLELDAALPNIFFLGFLEIDFDGLPLAKIEGEIRVIKNAAWNITLFGYFLFKVLTFEETFHIFLQEETVILGFSNVLFGIAIFFIGHRLIRSHYARIGLENLD